MGEGGSSKRRTNGMEEESKVIGGSGTGRGGGVYRWAGIYLALDRWKGFQGEYLRRH